MKNIKSRILTLIVLFWMSALTADYVYYFVSTDVIARRAFQVFQDRIIRVHH